jgi:hypothetical protein
MKKTFKIGEYAIGGILEAVVTSREISISALDFNTRDTVAKLTVAIRESRHSGNIRERFSEVLATLDSTLNDWTSCYHADKVMGFIALAIWIEVDRESRAF